MPERRSARPLPRLGPVLRSLVTRTAGAAPWPLARGVAGVRLGTTAVQALSPGTRRRVPPVPAARPAPQAPEGLVLTAEEQARLKDMLPDEGFAAAAETALGLLQARSDLDLWLVTRVRDGEQVVVVARGVAGMPVPPGAVQPWADSFCRLMVSGEGPRVAPRAKDVPAYASPGTGRPVRAYVGVPLLAVDGTLYGSLCGLSAREQPESLRDLLPDVEAVGRLLSTVLARESAAVERSHAAAEAYALVERDGVTGLLNRRGWEDRLVVEEERCRRTGAPSSVLTLDLEAEPNDELLHLVAVVLLELCRPIDVVARTGCSSFGLVAVACGPAEAREVRGRITRALRAAGLRVQVGVASRDADEDLAEAEQRAVEAAAAAHRS